MNILKKTSKIAKIYPPVLELLGLGADCIQLSWCLELLGKLRGEKTKKKWGGKGKKKAISGTPKRGENSFLSPWWCPGPRWAPQPRRAGGRLASWRRFWAPAWPPRLRKYQSCWRPLRACSGSPPSACWTLKKRIKWPFNKAGLAFLT